MLTPIAARAIRFHKPGIAQVSDDGRLAGEHDIDSHSTETFPEGQRGDYAFVSESGAQTHSPPPSGFCSTGKIGTTQNN